MILLVYYIGVIFIFVFSWQKYKLFHFLQTKTKKLFINYFFNRPNSQLIN